MRLIIAGLALGAVLEQALAGPFAPPAGQTGSNAIHYDDSRIVAWASAVGELVRGPYDISDPDSPTVAFGNPSAALGPADGFDPTTGQPLTSPNAVVSLGDAGFITLLFPNPITDGPAWDFVVFENAFDDTFLELAFVEVTSDGIHFVRFPATSLTQTATQISQSTETNSVDATNIDGLAGKYRASFGTPFDLSLLSGAPSLDVNRITAIRLVDVVGSIDPLYARRDSGNRMINDPWPTPFNTGSFDLDAIGVINAVPEPGGLCLLSIATIWAAARRPTRR